MNERRDRQGRNRREAGRVNRVSGARLVAYDVLRDVEDREAYANLALQARIREAKLDGRDAGLATELAAGTLRGRGRYDRIIELAAKRDVDDIDSRTRNVLRLGVHQLLAMRTASHAAVNESVELQRLVANQKAAGFVNGVLRTVSRATNEEWDARIVESAPNPDAALSVRASHPTWIVRALRDALRAEGREAELETLLAADNTPPRVSLAVLPTAPAASDLRRDDAEAPINPSERCFSVISAEGSSDIAVAGPSPLGVELTSGDPAQAIARLTRELDAPDGTVRVQDQGSQMAVLALTRARPARPGERWLDLCAGPGGKTAVLGAEALAAGVAVRANEVSEHRAELVRDSTRGLAEAVEVVSHDGREDEAFGGAAAVFDRILVDAPCTGLGALRRRPEARWRKQPSDLPPLTQLQAQLLDSAADHLAPGGLLAYVTCSPHLAETRVTVDRFLKRHTGLTEIDAKAALREVSREPLDLPGEAPSAQLWPHRHGTDAMFVALFERTG